MQTITLQIDETLLNEALQLTNLTTPQKPQNSPQS